MRLACTMLQTISKVSVDKVNKVWLFFRFITNSFVKAHLHPLSLNAPYIAINCIWHNKNMLKGTTILLQGNHNTSIVLGSEVCIFRMSNKILWLKQLKHRLLILLKESNFPGCVYYRALQQQKGWVFVMHMSVEHKYRPWAMLVKMSWYGRSGKKTVTWRMGENKTIIPAGI